MVFGFFACIADELDFCLCPCWVAPRFLSNDCAAFYPSLLTVSKRTFRTRVEGLRTHRFWACLSSDLGGVWLFRMHCRGT